MSSKVKKKQCRGEGNGSLQAKREISRDCCTMGGKIANLIRAAVQMTMSRISLIKRMCDSDQREYAGC